MGSIRLLGPPSFVKPLTRLIYAGKAELPPNQLETNYSSDQRLDEEFNRRIDELVRDPNLSRRERGRLIAGKLRCQLSRFRHEWPAFEDQSRLDDLVSEFHSVYSEYAKNQDVSKVMSLLVAVMTDDKNRRLFRITETRVRGILAPFVDAEDDELRNAALAFADRVTLDPGVPVAIQAMTFDGEPFDTRNLVGKIVMVDHWDTNCAPCISAMPALHDTYLEYKDRGFEVVSIAYDGASRRKVVERYKSEMGLTWTTLNGEGLWGAVAAKYGLDGFPSYMLLDREGKFVAGNDELRNVSNLPQLLDEMLVRESVEKNAGTIH